MSSSSITGSRKIAWTVLLSSPAFQHIIISNNNVSKRGGDGAVDKTHAFGETPMCP